MIPGLASRSIHCNKLLEGTPFGILANAFQNRSLRLGCFKNIGKKLFWFLSRKTSPTAIVLALRRSPPPGVSTSISGFSMIAACTSSV